MSVSPMPSPPPYAREVRCPMCQRYLGTIDVDGRYQRFPPCECGWQWVGEAVGKRARQTVGLPNGERLEIKAHR